jgi:hypothetical protein
MPNNIFQLGKQRRWNTHTKPVKRYKIDGAGGFAQI